MDFGQDIEAYELIPVDKQEESPPRLSAYRIVMSVFMLILINLAVIAVVMGFYLCIKMDFAKDPQTILNGLYWVGATALFVGLLWKGDLSKDNPNFYYI